MASPTRWVSFGIELVGWTVRRVPHWITRVERSHWRRFIVSTIAGLLILGVMRVPLVDRSMLGDLDRDMMQTAFKMRADVVTGVGDPVAFIDVDDATIASGLRAPPGQYASPPATAPRAIIAGVLEYLRTSPPGRGPRVVLVDVDLATPTPGDEAAVARLREVLTAWANSPNAPPLLLARESYPSRILGGGGNGLVLPASPIDDIVNPAPNMFWVQTKMLADQNAVVREFLPYECISGARGTEPLFNASMLAYGFLEGASIPPRSNVQRWIERAEQNCASGTAAQPILHGELINYHMSLTRTSRNQVWPNLPPTWRGFRTCGANADPTMFRQLSASDVATAGPDASHEILCGRVVILGGTNLVASDFQQTPLDDMAGPMILANTIRGLQMSNGGLTRVPLWIQLTVLLVVSLAITAGFTLSRMIRAHYLSLRTRHKQSSFIVRLSLLPINPLVLNWLFALGAHWMGIVLLLISLDQGYWGYLSAPAFAAAATGAMQEFADDDED